jgi:hypothetical protein
VQDYNLAHILLIVGLRLLIGAYSEKSSPWKKGNVGHEAENFVTKSSVRPEVLGGFLRTPSNWKKLLATLSITL